MKRELEIKKLKEKVHNLTQYIDVVENMIEQEGGFVPDEVLLRKRDELVRRREKAQIKLAAAEEVQQRWLL